MRKAIDSEFDRLVLDLREHESLRQIDVDPVGQVGRAVAWLQRSQQPEGYWGEQCLLDTQMTLLALGLWAVEPDVWELEGGVQGGVPIAFSWLEGFQDNAPGWEANVWDTSAILQAAAHFGYAKSPSMVAAREWIESRQSDNWGIDQGAGIHYLAQALMAMVSCGSPAHVIDQARSTLTFEADRLGVASAWTPYAKGQVLSALVVGGVNPANAVSGRLANELLEYLLTAEVTIANWLHLCSAFRGLGLSLGTATMDHPRLQVAVQRLFSPNRVRSDGSWYRSVPMTAWALIALESVRTVRMLDTYSFPVFQSLQRSRDALMREATRNARKQYWLFGYGAATALLATGAGLMISRILSGSPDFWEDREILLFVLPLVFGLISFVATRAWRVAKRSREQPGGEPFDP